MATQKKTFCRICEPYCPMVAHLNDEGKITRLSPDTEHLSGGIACHKGLSFLEVHNDPDRLDYPLKRTNPRSEDNAEFERTDWDSSLKEAGAKLKAILEKYGPNAIATYIGNPIAGNSRLGTVSARFNSQLKTQMRFSATSQDMGNKVVGAIAIYGSECMMVPDIANTDYLLCIGANPSVSKWTVVSVPNSSGEIVEDIVKRGGKVRFVNPRKIESSNPATGDTLLIKPGTDVYFLAAVLSEIHQLGGFDLSIINEHGRNIDLLVSFIQQYPAEKVETVTGIDADEIKAVAKEIIAAKTASIYMSTGVNQSRQGILAYWLCEMITFTTGNLGKKGGSYKPTGYLNKFGPSSLNAKDLETSVGTLSFPKPGGYTVVPGALTADLINNGDIKAFINISGNPIMTAGGEQAMREAFNKLEVSISIDIQKNATAEHSDYVFAGTDFLERADINTFNSGYQLIPYTQYTDPVEEPKADRKEDWWILARLMEEMGLKAPSVEGDGFEDLNKLLSFSGLSIEQVKGTDGQSVLLPESDPADVYEKCVKHSHNKVECFPPEFEQKGLIERCESIFKELSSESKDTLKLISLRTPYMQNSWYANVQKFRRGNLSLNPLNMCEQDARDQNLIDGDHIRISNENGSIETRVLINNDLRQGAVAMSHGFGRGRKGMTVAEANSGANCNQLMPTGPGSYEPMSHMSWLCGVPVKVEKIG